MSTSFDSLRSFILFIAEQIERIPAAAWVGIVGAFVVAWWANRGQTQRLRLQLDAENERLTEQLQHERSRLDIELADAAAGRTRERTASLKREVYLAAMSQLARTDYQLAQTPVDETPGLGGIDDLVLELGRVELVGGRKARELAAAVTAAYRNAGVAAAQARERVLAMRRDLDTAELEYRGVIARRELVVAQMQGILRESSGGIVNPAGMADYPHLARQSDELKSSMEVAQRTRLEATAAFDAARREAVQQVNSVLGEGRRLGAELASALREELGFVDPPDDVV